MKESSQICFLVEHEEIVHDLFFKQQPGSENPYVLFEYGRLWWA